MIRRYLLGFVATIGLLSVTSVCFSATYNTQDYDLYAGDFNGDGYTDILYIAKSPNNASGIAITNPATGQPNTTDAPWQSWPSNFLGIQWWGNAFNVFVGDFNGDGLADILLQNKTPGAQSYLLLSQPSGGFTAASVQTISNGMAGMNWSADQQTIVIGDFNGDGKADVFLQATTPSGKNAVVLGATNGLSSSTAQTPWSDGFLNLKWSSANAIVYAGDFNGDGKADLLVQAKPQWVMINYDVPFPVPTYPPNMNGIAFSASGGVFGSSVQVWSRMTNGVDWSPQTNNLIVGNFDSDACSDVLFQGKYSGRTSYLLTAANCGANGTIFPSTSVATAVSANVGITADAAHLIAGRFNGRSAPAGLFIQATGASGSSYVASAVSPSISASADDLSRNTGSGAVAGTIVGRTPGSAAVRADGSAAFQIPIKVPPGTAELTPNLSLAYDSEVPDGIIGMGWYVAGLSAITRCSATYAQDGTGSGIALAASDQYCLDGKRLRLSSGLQGADGSQYGTEIEKFSMIIAHGATGSGPAWFEVRSADGHIYEYGNTPDSQVHILGSTTVPRAWALDKISDRSTNYVSFSYTQDTVNGSFRPNQVNYTGNSSQSIAPYNTITFNYEARSTADPLLSYFAGSSIREPNRLKQITVANGANVIRSYNLAFTPPPLHSADERTTLASVQECAGTSTTCMGATSFNWQSPATGWASSANVSNAVATSKSTVILDLDGDGIPDAMWNEGGNACFALGSSTGFKAKTCTTVPFYYVASNTSPASLSTSQQVMDFRGDGRHELLQFNFSTGQWELLYLNAANTALVTQGLGFSDGWALVSGFWTITGPIGVSDIDGDGRDDFISSSSAGIVVRLSSGSGFAPPQTLYTFGPSTSPVACSILRGGNFDRSGRDSLFVDLSTTCPAGGDSWHVLTPRGSGAGMVLTQTANVPLIALGSYPPLVGDFNGDGIPDVAYVSQVGAAFNWSVMFGTGNPSMSLSSSVATGVTADPLNIFVADYNGDGRSDLIFKQSNAWYVALSVGDPQTTGGWFTPSPYTPTGISASSTVAGMATDSLGRGLDDLIILPTTPSGGISVYPHLVSYDRDRMTLVTDANQIQVLFAYAPLTQPGVYTKGTSAVFPSVDVQGARYVVTTETLSDGIGGQYSLNYFYKGAQLNLQGRGFLGFAETDGSDSRPNGLTEKRYFQQTFPFTGMLSQLDTFQSSGTLVSHVINTNISQTISSTSFEQRYFPHLQQRSLTNYEVGGAKNGQAILSSAETLSFDNYGNVLTSNKVLTDLDTIAPYAGQTWTKFIAYSPDVDSSNGAADTASSNWCVSLNDKTVVTYSTTLGTPPNITRTTQYQPDSDPTKCRIAHVIIEPGNAVYQVTTDYGFDGFGNVANETVTGISMTPRVTSISWSANGQFPSVMTNPMFPVTNPMAQNISLSFDPNFGEMNSFTDPNGIKTSWHFDAFGRKDTETRPDNTKTTWSYNFCAVLGCANNNNRMTVTQNILNADGSLSTTANTYFDQTERALISSGLTLGGSYDRNEVQYDQFGRVSQQAAPCFWSGCVSYWTVYSYDALSRPVQIQRPIAPSGVATQLIQYLGRIQTIVDANSNATSLVTDVNGWLRQTSDAAGYAVTLAYDAAGSNTGTTDSLGNTLLTAHYDYGLRAFQRDATDMDLDVSTATGQHSQATYNALGDLVTWSDANGHSFSETYDLLSRPVTRTEPDYFTKWTWGTGGASGLNIGQLQSVCTATVATDIASGVCDSSGYAESESYDTQGRYAGRTITIPAQGSFSYEWQYDPVTGRLSGMTYPITIGLPLQLQYAYRNGILQSIVDVSDSPNVNVWQANAANPAGQTTQETLGNGVITTKSFDPVTGWLGSIQSGLGGSTAIQNMGYLYDKVGNLTQRQDNGLGLTENAYPDSVNRLDHSTGPSNLQMHYDAMGNITSRSDIAAGASWTYDTVHKHRVLTAGDTSHTYTYDNNGNVKTRNGSSIVWAADNYPIAITSGSGTTLETLSFSYGPDRQRWQQVYSGNGIAETTNYIGDSIEQVISGGITDYRQYIFAGSLPVAVYSRKSNDLNTYSYLLSDHLGSISAITNSAGALTVGESFSPFGSRRNPTSWSGAASTSDLTTSAAVSRQGFTSQTALGIFTGLNHMNGRVQDSVTGRFLSADPFVADPTNTQEFNRYSYVDNNPLTFIDPSGFDAQAQDPGPAGNPPDTITVVGTRDGFHIDFGPTGAVASSLPSGSISSITVNSSDGSGVHRPTTEEAAAEIAKIKAENEELLLQSLQLQVEIEISEQSPSQVTTTLKQVGNGALNLASYLGVSAIEARLIKIFIMTREVVAARAVTASREVRLLTSGSRVANAGGRIISFVTERQQTFYRVYSNKRVGSFLTAVRPRSSAFAREALALPPDNTATFVQEVVVPAGTRLQRSRALGAFGRRGGAEQFELLDHIPTENFGPGVPLP